MPRILLVHQPTDGGVGRHVADIAAGLTERGFEVITCGPAPPEGSARSWEHLSLPLTRHVSLGDWRMVRQMSEVVSNVRPDLMHAHSSKAGAVVRLAKLRHPRVPALYTPHGFAFAGYFARAGERRVYFAAERLLGGLTTRAVCVCEAEARLARRVIPRDRVRVVYNGVGPAPDGPVDPRLERLAHKGPVVCSLGLLRAGKGVETLIEATPWIVARHPGASIAIWGDGPEDRPLQTRAARLGVEDAVHFFGRSFQPPALAMRGARVFAMPSWKESFPYVVLEAMSAGVPIVASDVGGVREAIRDGKDGLLVPSKDPRALAEAILSLIDDGDRAARIADAARTRVEREFTHRRMLEGTIQIYREVLT